MATTPPPAVAEALEPEKCFACGREGAGRFLVDTRDAQMPYVGPRCYRKVIAAGEAGYQPPRGGPRLYLLRGELLEGIARVLCGADPGGLPWEMMHDPGRARYLAMAHAAVAMLGAGPGGERARAIESALSQACTWFEGLIARGDFELTDEWTTQRNVARWRALLLPTPAPATETEER